MTWKVEDLPKVGSSLRQMMLVLTKAPQYEEDIKDSPFFTNGELEAIEEKYKNGISKAEILTELEKNKWLIKWNTVKHYIQKDLVPRASKRAKTDKGMISLYPPNFVRHLNLIRYCLFSHKQSIRSLIDLIGELMEHSNYDDHTIIASKSQELGDGISGDDCFHEFWTGNMRIENSIAWIHDSINSAGINDERKQHYLDKLTNLEKLTKELEDQMVAFENMLKSNKTPINLQDLESTLTRTIEKEPSS